MELYPCLICYKVVVPSMKASLSVGIDKQLDSIFILKELLRLPSTSLGKWLEMFPDVNPASWIRLCGDCAEMVGEGRKIFEEIVEASKRFKLVQEKVVETMKLSHNQKTDILDGSKKKKNRKANSRGTGSRLKTADVNVTVTEECRQFVNEHDYGGCRDPFTLGDLEAERWLGKSMDGAVHQFSEQVDVKEESDDGIPSPEPLDDNDDDSNQEYGLDNSEEEDAAQSENAGPSNEDKLQKKKSRPSLVDEEERFRLDNGKLGFRCKIPDCGAIYRSKRPFLEHKLRHSGAAPSFPCDQCQKAFLSMCQLKRHKHTHTAGRPKTIVPAEIREKRKISYQRKCPHCPIITDKYTLANHIKRVHEKVYHIYCEFCGKGESHSRDMRYHQAEIHGICSVPDCKLTFPGSREDLRTHQVEVHGKEVDVVSCGDCDKLFIRLGALQRHQLVYHQKVDKETGGDNDAGGGDDKQWICDVCGKEFILRRLLTIHSARHKKYWKRYAAKRRELGLPARKPKS